MTDGWFREKLTSRYHYCLEGTPVCCQTLRIDKEVLDGSEGERLCLLCVLVFRMWQLRTTLLMRRKLLIDRKHGKLIL